MRASLLLLSLGVFSSLVQAAPEKMKGVLIGDGATLSVQELPVPKPGAAEVLIKVRAAGVNPVDWKVASRRVGQVAGTDVSGVIDTLGEGVTGWKVGEQVLGFARQSGSYAEYAVVPVDSLARKPLSMTFEEAAGVPLERARGLPGKLDRGAAAALEHVYDFLEEMLLRCGVLSRRDLADIHVEEVTPAERVRVCAAGIHARPRAQLEPAQVEAEVLVDGDAFIADPDQVWIDEERRVGAGRGHWKNGITIRPTVRVCGGASCAALSLLRSQCC